MSEPPTDEWLRDMARYVSKGGLPSRGDFLRVTHELERLRAERRRYFVRLAIATRAGVELGDDVAAEAVRIDDLLEREGAILAAERRMAAREAGLPEAVRRLRASRGAPWLHGAPWPETESRGQSRNKLEVWVRENGLYPAEVGPLLQYLRTADLGALDGGWIACSDRLPPDGWYVLVSCAGERVGVAYHDSRGWDTPWIVPDSVPSHWRELPAPPREAEPARREEPSLAERINAHRAANEVRCWRCGGEGTYVTRHPEPGNPRASARVDCEACRGLGAVPAEAPR